jgi:hypothetical protein
MSDPVSVPSAARGLLAADGCVIVADERVADSFSAPGDDVERLYYGFSVLHCLPVGMPGAGTGAVMRVDTVPSYAVQAGFGEVEVLPIDNDFWRFYRLSVPWRGRGGGPAAARRSGSPLRGRRTRRGRASGSATRGRRSDGRTRGGRSSSRRRAIATARGCRRVPGPSRRARPASRRRGARCRASRHGLELNELDRPPVGATPFPVGMDGGVVQAREQGLDPRARHHRLVALLMQ